MRRIRALVGDALPIVTSLDFHTNMTAAMVRHASAMVGYRTYPHIDMAETGGRAAALLDQLIREKRPLAKAFRQADFLIPLVWQCTMAEPTKGVFALIDEIERGEASHNQGIVSITHTPGFPPADINECGPALVVYGHDQGAADAAADRILAAIKAREAEFAGRLYHRRRGGARRRSAWRKPRQSRSCSPIFRTIPAPAAPRTRSGCCAR